MNTAIDATAVDAYALFAEACLSLGLPRLEISTMYRTTYPSLTPERMWRGHLGSWDTFVKEVQDTLQDFPPGSENYMELRAIPDDIRAIIDAEDYVVGEEKGVEGRFNHNALRMVSKIARCKQKTAVFGDYRATCNSVEGTDLPDIALMTRDEHDLRACGEVKTDWQRNLPNAFLNRWGEQESSMTYEERDDAISSRIARIKWAGAIGSYLREANLRYGFVTTYEYTMFVKHELKSVSGYDDLLLVSAPISWSQMAQPEAVSVRQALWFLMAKAESHEDWKAPTISEETEISPKPEKFEKSSSKPTRPPSSRVQERMSKKRAQNYNNSERTVIKALPIVEVVADDGRLFTVEPEGMYNFPFKILRFYPEIDEITISKNGVDLRRVKASKQLKRGLLDQALEYGNMRSY